MGINLDFLTNAYFEFDLPVPYALNNSSKSYINILPIYLKDVYLFLSSYDVLTIDKNSYPDVEVIQMSYLQFLCQKVIDMKTDKGKIMGYKLGNILKVCLDLQNPEIMYKSNGKPYIRDNNTNIIINAKQFDDIKKIILYQNILHYDDSYINPDLQKAISDTKELENKNLTYPSLERRIAIITAHCGLSKKEQLEMTYRSHNALFEEVCGEVEFITTRPISKLFSKDEVDHWIFKKKKDKFDGYIQSVDSYNKSIGMGQAIKSSNTIKGDSYMQQYNNFN